MDAPPLQETEELVNGEAAEPEAAPEVAADEATQPDAALPLDESAVREPDRFSGHRVQLTVFEGPLDLLLYLVRAHRCDIVDIPICEVTRQFVDYLALMQELDLEYAGDFLVTAATLMQIKSRMLLPRNESQNEDALAQEECDPRRELVDRLLEYQRYQEAAETLKELREGRANTFARVPTAPDEGPPPDELEISATLLLGDISTFDLLRALQKVLDRQQERPVATIRRDPFTLSERVRDVLQRVLGCGEGVSFNSLCEDCQSRLEVVITFLALLELISRKKVAVEQPVHCAEIWVRKRVALAGEILPAELAAVPPA
jgi:segregation and condensation protein A